MSVLAFLNAYHSLRSIANRGTTTFSMRYERPTNPFVFRWIQNTGGGGHPSCTNRTVQRSFAVNSSAVGILRALLPKPPGVRYLAQAANTAHQRACFDSQPLRWSSVVR